MTIEPGDHRKAIALLPIAALRLEANVVEALRKLGFERIEQLIGEPSGPFAKRFGRQLFHRLDQAMGLMPEPIAPIFAEALPHCRRDFMEPIATADAFVQVIRDLVAEITLQLARLGAGARRLDCYFHRVDGHIKAVRVGTAAPSRNAGHLVKLLCARIESVEPGLGIEAMTLAASLIEPLAPLQGDALVGATSTGPNLAALVDALANRFGERQLYRVVPQASMMPERSSYSTVRGLTLLVFSEQMRASSVWVAGLQLSTIGVRRGPPLIAAPCLGVSGHRRLGPQPSWARPIGLEQHGRMDRNSSH